MMRAAIFLLLSGSAGLAEITLTTAPTDYTLQSNYWPYSQTFGGSNNNAPSQTAADASSVMTRSLVDTRQIDTYDAQASSVPLTAFSFTSSNGGAASASAGTGYATLASGTLASGYAVANASQTLNCDPGSGNGVQWFVPFTLVIKYALSTTPTPNTTAGFRVFSGSGNPPAINLPLASKGVDVAFVGTGTSMTAIPNVVVSSYSSTLTIGGTTALTGWALGKSGVLKIVNDGSSITVYHKWPNTSSWTNFGTVPAPSTSSPCSQAFYIKNDGGATTPAPGVVLKVFDYKVIDQAFQ